MNEQEFIAAIRTIPGDEGFWKSGVESAFVKIGKKLVANHNMTREEAREHLRNMYSLVSEEYGN